MFTEPEKNSWFGRVTSDIMQDPTLPTTAKALYGYLCTYTRAKDNLSFVSIDRMCAEMNITRSTVKRNLSILVEKKIIERYKQGSLWYNRMLK